MPRARLIRIVLVALLLSAALVLALRWSLMPVASPLSQDDVDRAAAYRHEHERGMTPCRWEQQDTARQARGVLLADGFDPALVAVVLPTFSGATVIGFGNEAITARTFSGETGFTDPVTWFESPEGKWVGIPLTGEESYTITAPLIRHARYPSSESRGGHDGTVYVLAWGDDCSYTWSPGEGDGQSALIAAMLEEVRSPAPSTRELARLAPQITDMDRRHVR